MNKSIVNSINKHLKSVFDMFGGQSSEYHLALQTVKENLNENVLSQTARQGVNYNADTPDKPLQLSTGKKALDILSNYETDVKNIREVQKETGSALEQAQKYIDELKAVGKEFSLQNIHEYAQTNYNFDNNSNDWYKSLTESEHLSASEIEEVRTIYSEVNHKYNDPSWREPNMNRLDELLKKHEKAKAEAQKKLEEDNTKIANEVLGGKPFETSASSLT